jgi:hypothetical protein
MEPITFDARTTREEHPFSWLYRDEFWGELYIWKNHVPDPPPEKVTITIVEA